MDIVSIGGENMSYCENCGAEVGESEKYCTNCGAFLNKDSTISDQNSTRRGDRNDDGESNKGKIIGSIVGLIIFLISMGLLTADYSQGSGLFGLAMAQYYAAVEVSGKISGIVLLVHSPVYPLIGYLFDKV